MAIETLIPEKFGPLQGVKIVSTGTLIAQPYAAELAAEMGKSDPPATTTS